MAVAGLDPMAQADRGDTFIAPAYHAAAVTPSDTDEMVNYSRALIVGTGGNIVVLMAGDAVAVTIKNVASGQLLPLRVKRVNNTNTTATDIVAVW